MPHDPTLQLIAVIVAIIIVLATAGAAACLIMDWMEAKKNKKSKELTAAPEKNSFDINLEALRPEVYNPNMMGSNIRRV